MRMRASYLAFIYQFDLWRRKHCRLVADGAARLLFAALPARLVRRLSCWYVRMLGASRSAIFILVREYIRGIVGKMWKMNCQMVCEQHGEHSGGVMWCMMKD